MKILILDDDVARHLLFRRKLIGHEVQSVLTVDETIEQLKNNTWDIVFLDHDLDGKVHVPSGPGTGYEVAEWLYYNPERKPKKIVIHSFCEKGRNNMKRLLPEAYIRPGVWIKENVLID